MIRRRTPTDPDIQTALQVVTAVADELNTHWAIVGGQALQIYGVPRSTEDVDTFIPPALLMDAAMLLFENYNWTPLDYDPKLEDYVETSKPIILYMPDDPVLMDIGEDRQMIAFHSTEGILVELLAAQHPVEEEMIDSALRAIHHDVSIPVAPLGGVLLVKMKANRLKDQGAIEQTAEHLSGPILAAAVEWAAERDPRTAEDLQAAIALVKTRRNPIRRSRR